MTMPFEPEQHFNRNCFRFCSIQSIHYGSLHESLLESKFACIRGILSPAQVAEAKTKLYETFDARRDHATVGESPKQVQSNFQKLSVGCARGQHHVGDSYGRLLRVFFNPMWDEDVYGMHPIFHDLVSVRNGILGKPNGYARTSIDDGMWTASRIHQYPIGGGFIQAHRDRTQAGVCEDARMSFYQVFAILSEKGEDFEAGGGFIQYGDSRFIIDDFAIPGDIVIYDGATLHGVEDIDPFRLLDLSSAKGRLSAFVTLYREASA